MTERECVIRCDTHVRFAEAALIACIWNRSGPEIVREAQDALGRAWACAGDRYDCPDPTDADV